MTKAKIKDKDNYYSTREAAKLLGVAVSTIQLWTNNGILDAWITAGGHRRIFASSVNTLFEQQTGLNKDNKVKNAKLSLVIVEDSESLQKLYQQQLDSLGFDLNVVFASDGFQGLIKIGEICPDIIITDLMMPNMDGFQLLKALINFESLKDSLIIAVSALSQREVNSKGGLPDEVEFISKPFLIEDMKRVIIKKLNNNN